MQHRKRFELGLAAAIVIAVLALAGGSSGAVLPVMAQGGETCDGAVAEALQAVQAACGDVARGEVCYGFATVTAEASADASEGQAATLAAPGDRAPLAALDSVTTAAANADVSEWGAAAIRLSGGLPAEEAGVTAFLFGEARIARPVLGEDRPTLVVRNGSSGDVNLRGGAGSVGYDVVGILAPGDEAVADGRNEQGDWVRIRYNDSVAWVFTQLIDWEGDLQTLKVLAPNDLTPAVVAGDPFDAFTLITGPASATCAAASSGLLLQYSGPTTDAGQTSARLVINGVSVEFADATLVVSAAANGALDIKALAGTATITSLGGAEEIAAGETARVTLGGADGLTPATVPDVLGAYAFLDIVHVPVSLLPGALTCRVGLPEASADVRLRVGPGDQRGELAQMSGTRSYGVLGWANDPEGEPWWELDTGTQPSWVRQSQVRTLGDCAAVAQVEAPPVVLGAGSSAASGGQPASGPDLAPTANSVWQMRPGTDQMSGQCSGAPAINFCDHLAAIAPAAGGISWKGMEASPYILAQVQPNVYRYAGPNALGTGQVTMTLTFSAANQLNMTMVLTLNNEPACQHTYYYTGTKNW